MVDLWNGVFGLVAAVLGGVITGLSMLWQQKREFRQRATDALRALLVEAQDNEGLVALLQESISEIPTNLRPPRVDSLVPILVRREVWNTLLPLVAGPLDKVSGLEAVVNAYRGIDFIRRFPLYSENIYRIEESQKDLGVRPRNFAD